MSNPTPDDLIRNPPITEADDVLSEHPGTFEDGVEDAIDAANAEAAPRVYDEGDEGYSDDERQVDRICMALVEDDFGQDVVSISQGNSSDKPVTTAVYFLAIAMNEDDPDPDENHEAAFAEELQRALDDGYFTDLRYDALTFDVIRRVVINIAPANEKED